MYSKTTKRNQENHTQDVMSLCTQTMVHHIKVTALSKQYNSYETVSYCKQIVCKHSCQNIFARTGSVVYRLPAKNFPLL